jgi:hypothetical protein
MCIPFFSFRLTHFNPLLRVCYKDMLVASKVERLVDLCQGELPALFPTATKFSEVQKLGQCLKRYRVGERHSCA